MRVTPPFFICWRIWASAWLSFWAVLKTQGATGLTMASAAAQESKSVFDSPASALTARVSPEVAGPMMAKTCSSSMSCLAKEMAFSGLPAVSLTMSFTGRPPTPPRALRLAASISRVRASGAPRKAAGPVTESSAPTLMGSAAAAGTAASAAASAAARAGVGVFLISILLLDGAAGTGRRLTAPGRRPARGGWRRRRAARPPPDPPRRT